MGSKNSKPENKDSGAQSANAQGASNNTQSTQLPIQSVDERKREERRAQKKAVDDLPTIYVDCPKNGEKAKVNVPPGGAKVCFRGQDGQKVKMTPSGPPKTEPQKTVKVIRTYPGTRGGVVYSAPTQVIQVDGNASATTDNIVVIKQPAVYVDPCYPYYYPYGYYPYRYGCYPYRYYYW